MSLYYNKPLHEVLQDVRDRAVAAKAGWQLIDVIDELITQPTQEDHEKEVSKLADELEEANKSKDDLLEALSQLLDALPDNAGELCEDNEVDRYIGFAKQARSRNET